MEVVERWEEPRGNPFKFFPCFFSKKDFTWRYISNNDHYNSVIKLGNGMWIRGEDPRSFVMKGRRYILSNIYMGNFIGTRYNIIDYDTGDNYQYTVHEPNFFYGKNWTPCVVSDSMIFIHAFDPFTILKDGKILFTKELGLEKRKCDNFCKWRGNSNGIEYNEFIYGFGHISEDIKEYNAFMWIIDRKNLTLSIAKIDYQKDEYPYTHFCSIWKEGSETYVGVWDESGDCFDMDIKTRTSIFKIYFEKLKESLTWKTFTVPEIQLI